jgi:hypothetical protein
MVRIHDRRLTSSKMQLNHEQLFIAKCFIDDLCKDLEPLRSHSNEGVHRKSSVLKYGPPVEKTILEIFRNPSNLKRHILKSAFTEIPP